MIEIALGIIAFIFIAFCVAFAVSCVIGAVLWLASVFY